jgi:hypothetical protein
VSALLRGSFQGYLRLAKLVGGKALRDPGPMFPLRHVIGRAMQHSN